MQYRIEHFERYLTLAEQSEKNLLEECPPLLTALRSYHEFFVTHVFAEKSFMSPIQSLLSMHAFMMYEAAIHTAMSGHSAATFPLYRAALEASCYALIIDDPPELERAWLERNSSGEAMRACKTKFGSAVKDAAEKFRLYDWASPITEDWILEAYDAAIDFGAHPNPKSIFPYVSFSQDTPESLAVVSLTSLYPSSSSQTHRSLIACLDYGLIVALVILGCHQELSEDTILAFNDLHELKEELAEKYFPGSRLQNPDGLGAMQEHPD